MAFNFDTINVLLLFILGINLLYGLIVYTRDTKDKTNSLFFAVTVAVSFWSIFMLGFRGFEDHALVLLFSRVLYVAAAAIPLSFLYFTFTFPNSETHFSWWQRWLLPLPFLCVAFLALHPHGLIYSIAFPEGAERIISFNWYGHLAYALYIMGYFGWAYINLFKKLIHSTGIVRTQILFIATGTLISTVLGVISNLILPFMGIFTVNWFGQVAVVGMIVLISYAILKHHLFDIKVVATEILTVSFWGVILIRIFLAKDPEERFVNIVFLAITILLGAFIVQSVRKEVDSREKIQKLAEDLELANAKLRELDQQKSEFVSIASHQLRSPLTAIKGYVSMLLEDTPSYGNIHHGVITAAGIEALSRVMKSANNLVAIIEDLLNISRIEQGRMQYTMSEFDVREMAFELVENLAINAKERGLTITFHGDEKPLMISGDSGKVRQVINNIIDNSIKYTPQGSIEVTLSVTPEKKPLLAVKDTGIGISQENIGKLFQKFSRAEGAGKVNVTGTGIGLFIAQEIMKAHHGRIWIESPGEGKGSTFFIEFPAQAAEAAAIAA